MKTEVIYIRLDKKLKRQIEAGAKEYGQSVAEFTRSVLRQWFPMQESRKYTDVA